MDDQPQGHASDLQALAEANFGTLSDAEKLLLERVPIGEWSVCGPNDNNRDKANDPKDADNWGPARRIRAALLDWLCTDGEARKQVHWQGVQLYGADVTGSLDLSLVSIPFQLALRRCRLQEVMILSQAEVSQLDLQGSLVPGIGADGVIVKNQVLLGNGFTAAGGVRFSGAQIGSDFDCSGGAFTNPPQKNVPASGMALDAARINVKGYVFFSNAFIASGEVGLLSAQIGGNLDCSGGTFTNPPQKDVPGGGTALNAELINCKGDVLLRNGFNASGKVCLNGAQIGNDLDCSGGTFTNSPQKDVPESSIALSAELINCKSDVLLRNGFHASGEVTFDGAQIGSDFDCSGGTFTNPPQNIPGGGTALSADGINSKGSVFLSEGFKASGEVWLLGAQIGGDLDCSQGTFTNPIQEDVDWGGSALNAERIIVKSTVFLSGGFTANGVVTLYSAQIGVPFDCSSGNFQKATLKLTDASTASFYDSGLNNTSSVGDETPTIWPQPGKLYLDGFVYGRISSEGQIDVTKRLDWLGLQPTTTFHRQPYLQLAKVLRGSGDFGGARRVLEKMEELRRSNDKHGTIAPLWSWILKRSIGYGYYPGRAIWLIILLSLLGWIVYATSYHAGTMVPSDKDAYNEFRGPKTERQVPPHYPGFSAPVYSLENSLPLVKMGQTDKWQPDPAPDGWRPILVRWFLRMQILLGWLLATFFVAAVSGIVHKE